MVRLSAAVRAALGFASLRCVALAPYGRHLLHPAALQQKIIALATVASLAESRV